MSSYLYIGNSYENICTLTLSDYSNSKETIFYDLFVIDTDEKVFPVATKVINLKLVFSYVFSYFLDAIQEIWMVPNRISTMGVKILILIP